MMHACTHIHIYAIVNSKQLIWHKHCWCTHTHNFQCEYVLFVASNFNFQWILPKISILQCLHWAYQKTNTKNCVFPLLRRLKCGACQKLIDFEIKSNGVSSSIHTSILNFFWLDFQTQYTNWKIYAISAKSKKIFFCCFVSSKS